MEVAQFLVLLYWVLIPESFVILVGKVISVLGAPSVTAMMELVWQPQQTEHCPVPAHEAFTVPPAVSEKLASCQLLPLL